MKVLYLPVFRVPVNYTVSYGRRWSVLEHLLLVELARGGRSVAWLAEGFDLPERLIVEALINLLRAGWIEVRSVEEVAVFSVTPTGMKRAAEPKLKAELKRRVRRASLCMDRITGSWMNGDELDLVPERDLPAEATALEPLTNSLDTQNGEVRELLPLEDDEAFERLEPNGRTAGRFYARVEVGIGGIQGLPAAAPWRLSEALLRLGGTGNDAEADDETASEIMSQHVNRETISAENMVVGGSAHLELIRRMLREAKSHVIVHSCFLHPTVIANLVDDFEAAALRKVRVDLLWGLVVDPEDTAARRSVADCVQALQKLSERGRSRVHMSAVSSSSHLKAIVADSGPGGSWETAIGSCNFLSSWYDLIETSIVLRNPRIAAQVLGYLVDAQLPASGGWSPVVSRLNRVWNAVSRIARQHVEAGDHKIQLLMDRDHHACIRYARDSKSASIILGCDLFGMASETSVLVPMERAHELGASVDLLYRRPSKTLVEQSARPDRDALAARGLNLLVKDDLHGKFMVWGEDGLAVTSFNWLSTSVGARTRGAELGVMIEGPGLRSAFAGQVATVDPALATIFSVERQGTLRLPPS